METKEIIRCYKVEDIESQKYGYQCVINGSGREAIAALVSVVAVAYQGIKNDGYKPVNEIDGILMDCFKVGIRIGKDQARKVNYKQ